ncbi:MAG: hypothetical protein CSA35_02830 [Dethiosulfovibrio peptidovorans]|nr:MAG: hypothetical protein CSA35_02830 [Dethiosulfovibrio peptidovorans]
MSDAKARPQFFIDVGENRINRIHDRFFKSLFGRKEHCAILLDFINDIVFPEGERHFTKLIKTNTEMPPAVQHLKLSQLDLSVELDDGVTVDIEVQLLNRRDFKKRAPFYWAMRHSSKLESGVPYSKITKTIVICVLAFTLLREEKPYRNVYGIANLKSGKPLCDDMQIIYLELDKFQKEDPLPRQTGLQRWLTYLSNVEGEKMREIAEVDKEIAQALLFERNFWADRDQMLNYVPEQKVLIESLMNESDYEERIEEARGEGRVEGRVEGRAEGRVEGRAEGRAEGLEEGDRKRALSIAWNLLGRGMSEAEVCDITNLSPDDIAHLRARKSSQG